MFDPDSLLEEETEPTGDLSESIRTLPAATLWAFVLTAAFAQAGLFGVSLGLMLVGFRGQWAIGGLLAAAGTVALLAAIAVREWQRAVTADR
ncbi:DUF7322 domain-containing protein [Haloplanus salilacus]|uniref:DUF7322 domain-containing protein n=1 Tax=Haloplanus salilacus TaxID=2949994 RepID=UPI0030CB21D1